MASCCLANSLTCSSNGFKKWPQNFFDWNFGRSNKTADNKKPQPKYHDEVQLPFSPSLVSKTFLKGTLFL